MMLPAIPNGMEPAADEESSEPLLLLQDQRSRSNTTSQVAIVGSDLCPIESLDYEIIENVFFKQDWRTMGTTDARTWGLLHLLPYSLCLLVPIVVVSLVTALIAPEAAGSGIPEVKAYLNGVDAPAIFSFRTLVVKLIRRECPGWTRMQRARGLYMFNLLSGTTHIEVAKKEKSFAREGRNKERREREKELGAGDSERLAYRGHRLSQVYGPRCAPLALRVCCQRDEGYGWRGISTSWEDMHLHSEAPSMEYSWKPFIAVSSSLNVGKAGAHGSTLGACVAAIMGQGGSKKSGLTCKWLQVLKNDRDRRDLVTCGSAAGYGRCFSCSSWVEKCFAVESFLHNCCCCYSSSGSYRCLLRECGLFGKGGLIMYDVTSANISYHLRDVPAVLLLAVIGGLLGSQISFSTLRIIPRYKFKGFYIVCDRKGIAYRILLACFISISTSCLLFGLPWIASCRLCPSDASEPCPTIGRSGNYKKFQCPPGYYNDLASLFFNTNDDAIKNLFSKGTDTEFHHSSMLIFFATCFFLSTFSYGIVAPTGLFVPVIVTGAAYGRFVGMCVGSNLNLNHGLFAVLGSASLLGGSMRMTVSLCVIILELTDNLLLLPLIMLVLLISKTVADVFDANIYDIIMTLKGLPYLKPHADPYMRQLTVGDVVTGPLQIFHGIEKVGNIVHVLRTTGHNGFPVVDEPPLSLSPLLYGLILRSHLVTLLRKKLFFKTPTPVGLHAFLQFSADDFTTKDLGHCDQIEDIELSEEEMEMFVDLHPFTTHHPTLFRDHVISESPNTLREVGLRHLLVIPKVSGRLPVVGILTRHDFMPEHVKNLHPRLSRSRWRSKLQGLSNNGIRLVVSGMLDFDLAKKLK
ncbi:putative chloride channel-like protein CLC-g [Sesamum angolense]|uniref:Chloride channel-like protein CLC-g n=1 Tax=Sesamum angolense TaxID=2727404 RepID=A0AAE1WE17_9LAMI|nr:putative chloride channel-like protein CLC-g [Sesamum angolense]